jgi:isopentenyldiphosphate isomerase
MTQMAKKISRVLVKDTHGKYLVPERSNKESRYPNYWDFGIVETLNKKESFVSAAVRGLNEELGIIVTEAEIKDGFQFELKYISTTDTVHANVFEISYSGKIKSNLDELGKIMFLHLTKIKEMMGKKTFTPGAIRAYTIYMKQRDNQL